VTDAASPSGPLRRRAGAPAGRPASPLRRAAAGYMPGSMGLSTSPPLPTQSLKLPRL
jgi:hypothetical protein